MRKLFASYLLEEMKINDKIIIITADIGYGVLDEIREKYPERFFNVGSSEALMIGMAIGLCYEGKIPFCYTITTFLLYRPFDMIRNYINYEVFHMIFYMFHCLFVWLFRNI
jgi:transketolase